MSLEVPVLEEGTGRNGGIVLCVALQAAVCAWGKPRSLTSCTRRILWPRASLWRRGSCEQLAANIHSSCGTDLAKRIWVGTNASMIVTVPGGVTPQSQFHLSFLSEDLSGPSSLR